MSSPDRHDALIGVMNLDHHEQAVPFEPAQVDLALAVAGQSALFLENARLYAEARERLWETTTLVAVSQALSQSGPTVEIMRRVAREMTRAFGADMTGMYVLDAVRERLVPLAGHHVPHELVERFRATPIPIAMYPKLKEAWQGWRGVEPRPCPRPALRGDMARGRASPLGALRGRPQPGGAGGRDVRPVVGREPRRAAVGGSPHRGHRRAGGPRVREPRPHAADRDQAA